MSNHCLPFLVIAKTWIQLDQKTFNTPSITYTYERPWSLHAKAFIICFTITNHYCINLINFSWLLTFQRKDKLNIAEKYWCGKTKDIVLVLVYSMNYLLIYWYFRTFLTYQKYFYLMKYNSIGLLRSLRITHIRNLVLLFPHNSWCRLHLTRFFKMFYFFRVYFSIRLCADIFSFYISLFS